MKQRPYSWNFALVMYPFVVAASLMFPDFFKHHMSCTCTLFSMTIGRTTCPYPLTKVRMEVVSPCSLDTCWKVLICLTPRIFTSLGTFWTPVSSSLHICDWDTISHLSLISFNNLNQLPITVGFAPIALAMDKFLAFLIKINGFHLRKPFSHLRPALPFLSLKPGFRLFTLHTDRPVHILCLWSDGTH